MTSLFTLYERVKKKNPIIYNAGIPLEYEHMISKVEIILEIALGPSHSGPMYNAFSYSYNFYLEFGSSSISSSRSFFRLGLNRRSNNLLISMFTYFYNSGIFVKTAERKIVLQSYQPTTLYQLGSKPLQIFLFGDPRRAFIVFDGSKLIIRMIRPILKNSMETI